MNLVDSIKDQLSGDVLSKLGGLLGENEATTAKATTAAVPSLLSVLAALVSSQGGIQKLIEALRNLGAGSLGDVLGGLRTGDAAAVQQKGGDLLGSLLGGGTLAALVAALSKFSGLGSGSTKGLLAYLMPLVLGSIAGQFKNRP